MHPSLPHIVFYNPRCSKPGFHRMPLSLMRLAGSLDGVASCDIIDGNLPGDPAVETVLSRCSDTSAKYLGVTIMPGPQLQQAIPDLIRIRAQNPGLIVVVGGYFPSIYWEQCAAHPTIDYIVIGAGEGTIRKLVEVLEGGGDPATVPGIAFQVDGRPVRTSVPDPIDPDALPRLPYELIDIERYVVPTHLGRRTLSHHSSMGCPFRCNFCAAPIVAGERWVAESAERLLETTTYLVDSFAIDALEFHDNNFFASESRVVAYCLGLLEERIRIRWWGEGRVDTLLHFQPETWDLMARSGLAMVFMGAESGHSETLGRMNKGGTLSPEETIELVRLAARYRIVPELSFICGNPPDPEQDIRQCIRFIRAVKRANPVTEIILYRYDPVPFPGAMWDAATASGIKMPESLEEWIGERWALIHRRRMADLPWISGKQQRHVRDFETVLNAYYPTYTSRERIRPVMRLLLRFLSAWRYHSGWYRNPVELRVIQSVIQYRRPEVSGF